jgi:hypothetical protein
MRFEVLATVVMNSQPTFRRIMSPSYSWSKNKLSKKPAGSKLCLLSHAGFGREDGGCMFLRNFGWLSTHFMTLHPRRHNSSRSNNIKSLELNSIHSLLAYGDNSECPTLLYPITTIQKNMVASCHQTSKIPVKLAQTVTLIFGRSRVQTDRAVGMETAWTNEGSEFESP